MGKNQRQNTGIAAGIVLSVSTIFKKQMDRHITAGTLLVQSPLLEKRAWRYVSKTKPQQPHVTEHTIDFRCVS